MEKDLSLPDALVDSNCIAKMLTIVFPCTARKPLDGLHHQLNAAQRAFYVQVFKENSVKLRNKLFSDPLIKHLWSKVFIVEKPETCIAHLRRIRSSPEHGEVKYGKVLSDMIKIEVAFNFKMLPDSARD